MRGPRSDLVVAVTDNDELNLVAALTAQKLGARVLVAQELAKIARSHGALDVINLANERIELVQVVLGERAEALGTDLEDVTVVHGDGTDMQLLQQEEVGTFDLVAAVTQHDEINLMASLLARQVGAGRVAALVQRGDYMPIYRQLGIDIVLSPRVVASDHIMRYCRESELQSLTQLENGQAEVLEFRAREGARTIGVPLRRLKIPRGALLAAIVHHDHVVIPGGDDVVQSGDTVVVLTTTSVRASVERLFRPRIL